MAQLNDVYSTFGNIEAIMNDVAHEKLQEIGGELCSTINYEMSIIGVEIASFDKNIYYDPEHAQQIESHLLKHLSELCHAELETSDNDLAVRVKIIMPEMTISDKVTNCINMCISNGLRRCGRG